MKPPSYWTGRRTLSAIAVWLVALALGFVLWRQQFVTYFLAQAYPRCIAITEIGGILGAAIAAALLLPQAPVVDRLATRPFGVYAAATSTVTIVAFAAIPLLMCGWVRIAPGLTPPGTWVDVSDEIRTVPQILTPALAGSIAITIAVFAGIAFIFARLLGPAGGPTATVVFYFMTVIAQSSSLGDAIPLAGAGPDPYTVHPGGIVLAIIVLAAAAALWAVRSTGRLRLSRTA